jgi:hypothetical protein
MVKSILAGVKTQTRRPLRKQPPPECGIHYMLGNESWLPVEKKNPLRHTWEAWAGDLYRNRPKKCMCGAFDVVSPFGQPGDRLWVRETFSIQEEVDGEDPPFSDGRPTLRLDGEYENHSWEQAHYRATDETPELTCEHEKCEGGPCVHPWHPSIFMPRWASRITLEIMEVRVQRVQEISEEDAIAEGVEKHGEFPNITPWKNYQLSPGSPGCMNFSIARRSFNSLWDSINAKRGFGWDKNPWVWAITFRRIVP